MTGKSFIAGILSFVRQKARLARAFGVVVGLSGGVDSAVVAKLCVQALGKDKVLALIMPDGKSGKHDVQKAERFAKSLAIKYVVVDISAIARELEKQSDDGNKAVVGKKDKQGYAVVARKAKGNVRPRLRMAVLYYYANSLNYLVAGTGNKSELLTGYFSKYGDGGVDFLPIGGLYKTQVWQLARELKIASEIVDAAPSAGLWKGQTDEKEMGITYALLDKLLEKLYDEKKTASAAAKELNVPVATARKVEKMVLLSKHKREMPPVFLF